MAGKVLLNEGKYIKFNGSYYMYNGVINPLLNVTFSMKTNVDVINPSPNRDLMYQEINYSYEIHLNHISNDNDVIKEVIYKTNNQSDLKTVFEEIFKALTK